MQDQAPSARDSASGRGGRRPGRAARKRAERQLAAQEAVARKPGGPSEELSRFLSEWPFDRPQLRTYLGCVSSVRANALPQLHDTCIDACNALCNMAFVTLTAVQNGMQPPVAAISTASVAAAAGMAFLQGQLGRRQHVTADEAT